MAQRKMTQKQVQAKYDEACRLLAEWAQIRRERLKNHAPVDDAEFVKLALVYIADDVTEQLRKM